ncbi:MAG: hypothetical protein MR433_01970 [Coriobacteriaceae bacterium]|nr:hypothetical protein [Coriobacteriaceae bacterium]
MAKHATCDTTGGLVDRRGALAAVVGLAAMGPVALARAEATGGDAGESVEEVSADAITNESGVISVGGFTLLPYPHFASGGVKQDLYAAILFENSNSTFTRYQVAFTSCTCRDAASNYRSVMYVEMLNTAASAEEAKLRWVCFADNEGYDVGVWGDSNPIHGQPAYTAEYMDENFVAPLVGLTKADFDAWGGYGTQVAGIDVDTVTGATVSTSNVTSVLRALFAYHAEKYYGA